MAFEGPLVQGTPQAIAMFLAWKCFSQDNSQGTAPDGIHAVQCNGSTQISYETFRTQTKSDTYRGRWHFDKERAGWFGNPVRSAEIEDLMRSIKRKNGGEGSERHLSLAMSKQFMDKLFE